MTDYLRLQLRTLTAQWRQTAETTRLVIDETPDPALQGHIQGVSDGLVIAAEDVDKLLAEPDGNTLT